jgi:hypothetical protein
MNSPVQFTPGEVARYTLSAYQTCNNGEMQNGGAGVLFTRGKTQTLQSILRTGAGTAIRSADAVATFSNSKRR